MQLKHFLRALPGFQFMSDSDVEHLAAAMRVEDYPNHHVFIYQDKLNHDLFLLLDGHVKVSHYGKGGRHYTIKTLMPGEFFGIPSLSEGKPADVTCSAEGNVKVASLPYSAYLLLYQPGSDVGCHFQFVLATQLARDLQERHDTLRKLLTQVYGAEPRPAAGE